MKIKKVGFLWFNKGLQGLLANNIAEVYLILNVNIITIKASLIIIFDIFVVKNKGSVFSKTNLELFLNITLQRSISSEIMCFSWNKT